MLERMRGEPGEQEQLQDFISVCSEAPQRELGGTTDVQEKG